MLNLSPFHGLRGQLAPDSMHHSASFLPEQPSKRGQLAPDPTFQINLTRGQHPPDSKFSVGRIHSVSPSFKGVSICRIGTLIGLTATISHSRFIPPVRGQYGPEYPTIPIYKDKMGLVGAICINVDYNYLNDEGRNDPNLINDFLNSMCKVDMKLDENILGKTEYEKALKGKRHFRDF